MNELHQNSIAAGRGVPLEEAAGAVVMIHGRGDSAQGILQLADVIKRPGLAFVAPQATNNTWYPHSFLMPTERNEPWLSSALAAVAGVVDEVMAADLATERIVLLGFSQGACLASEFAARNAGRFGGVVALSGGLIGPEGTSRDYSGSLAGTPVFFGCSDIDPHIPVERVHESARVMAGLDGEVDERIYPGMGHTVNRDEIDFVRDLLDRLLAPAEQGEG